MGLLHILKKLKHKEKQVRLLMLYDPLLLLERLDNMDNSGLDNAGKTTVVNKFSGKPTDTICPTLGFHICSLDYRGYCLNIWDVGGQQTIRSYWRNYFEQTDGLVWVIDSADTRRLLECRDQLRILLKEERLSGASLLVLANKQDLKGALDEASLAELLELEKIISHHWHIEAVSALTGEGLQKGIDWLVTDIASRIFLLD